MFYFYLKTMALHEMKNKFLNDTQKINTISCQ